jgi:hypothetical protein
VFAAARSNEKDVHRSIPAGTNPNGLYHRGMSDETPLNGAAETAPKSNIREFTVTELSNLLKRTVEDAFPWVRVKGKSRASRVTPAATVISTSRMTDPFSAQSSGKRGHRLKVKPEQGLEVVCTGRLTTFPASPNTSSSWRRWSWPGWAR